MIGSRRKRAAKNIVRIGVMVVMMDRSTGVVRAMAFRNVSCGRKTTSCTEYKKAKGQTRMEV